MFFELSIFELTCNRVLKNNSIFISVILFILFTTNFLFSSNVQHHYLSPIYKSSTRYNMYKVQCSRDIPLSPCCSSSRWSNELCLGERPRADSLSLPWLSDWGEFYSPLNTKRLHKDRKHKAFLMLLTNFTVTLFNRKTTLLTRGSGSTKSFKTIVFMISYFLTELKIPSQSCFSF